MLLPFINKAFFDDNGDVLIEYDVDHILENYNSDSNQKFYIYVGSRDFFSYSQSYNLYKKMKDKLISVDIKESDGVHDIKYWNDIIETIIEDLVEG